jgi:methylamine dehydrogenase accessory protein MauD
MTSALIISNIILWLTVIGLSVLVFALTRQVGVLHERVAPAGALTPTSGPKIGETTEIVRTTNLDGEKLSIGGAAQGATLVFFLSPTCPVCRNLVPTAKSLASYEDLNLIFASDGDSLEQHQNYATELKIDFKAYVLSQALGLGYGVSKLPFAVLIAKDGSLAAKGLVNTREHLESLLESMNSGIATLQDYVKEYVP